MRKIGKIINIAFIFILGGVFLGVKPGYSVAEPMLRPNLINKDTKGGNRLHRTTTYLLDMALVQKNKGLLGELTERQRQVLTMIYLEGKTAKETAESMGIDESTVTHHKQKGLTRLRWLINPDPDSDYQIVQKNKGLLGELTERQRQVLIMIYLEGKTAKETAESMGISTALVTYHKQRALARLKELINPDSDYQIVQKNKGLLGELTEQERQVLTMIYLEGKTAKETAESMGISTALVTYHKQRALARLKKLINPDSDYQIVQKNKGLLGELTERQRQVLTMIYLEGKTAKETAESMGIDESVVTHHKQKGLTRLRWLINPDPDSDYQIVQKNKGLLGELTERQRQVLTMIYLEGKTAKETAESMGIDESVVTHHKQKGLTRLKELINRARKTAVTSKFRGALQVGVWKPIRESENDGTVPNSLSLTYSERAVMTRLAHAKESLRLVSEEEGDIVDKVKNGAHRKELDKEYGGNRWPRYLRSAMMKLGAETAGDLLSIHKGCPSISEGLQLNTASHRYISTQL
jgi:DNA-directed RNA polymerase specialized sigma24 family protein